MIPCEFCGRECSNKQSHGAHVVRCLKNPHRKIWSRAGIANGTPRIRVKRSDRFDGQPTSACCDAPVKVGKRHDIGNRYCTKCGRGCYWRSNGAMPTEWTCKTPGCKSIMPKADGYCFKCYAKRKGGDFEEPDPTGTI